MGYKFVKFSDMICYLCNLFSCRLHDPLVKFVQPQKFCSLEPCCIQTSCVLGLLVFVLVVDVLASRCAPEGFFFCPPLCISAFAFSRRWLDGCVPKWCLPPRVPPVLFAELFATLNALCPESGRA